jgi:hypothetical protein
MRPVGDCLHLSSPAHHPPDAGDGVERSHADDNAVELRSERRPRVPDDVRPNVRVASLVEEIASGSSITDRQPRGSARERDRDRPRDAAKLRVDLCDRRPCFRSVPTRSPGRPGGQAGTATGSRAASDGNPVCLPAFAVDSAHSGRGAADRPHGTTPTATPSSGARKLVRFTILAVAGSTRISVREPSVSRTEPRPAATHVGSVPWRLRS